VSLSISRRGFLGALGALGASQLVPSSVMADNTPPKRLIVVFSANGTIYDNWAPTGTETSFALAPILSPLEAFKDRLVILDGIDVKSAQNGPGDDHMKGMGHMLTGIELLAGNTQGGAGTPAGLAGGISIDQRIANEIGTTTRFKSLEFGAYVQSSDVWSRMIYADQNQPLPPMEDPAKAYARIFSGSQLDPAALALLLKRRQSVLDHASGTLDKLAASVGTDDRIRVQAHAASVRQIEKQLLAQTAACTPPTPGGTIDITQNENYEAVGQLMMDMIVATIACDQTRVASLQFSHSVSMMTFPSLGISDGHHDLSHVGDTDATAKAKLVSINTFYAKQFAYLLGKLDAVKESNGSSLLDNSMVLWVNELAKGNIHSHNPLPVVIAGKCGGALRTGRYLKLPQSQPHNNLLVSVANAMGVSMTTFGNPAYCTGPLTAL
jgi:Protein of unknown function (DUF1552)